MKITQYVRKLKTRIQLLKFVLLNPGKEKFECPVCDYRGPFADINPSTGFRKHAQCPQCGALERHRLQYVVVMDVLKNMNASKMRMLHFAPEMFFMKIFSRLFGKYETADMSMKNVDYNVDIQHLPFDDASLILFLLPMYLSIYPTTKKQ